MSNYIEKGIIYEDDTKTKIFESEKDISNVLVIPDSVKSIGNRAFVACYGLKNITIPDSVINIGKDVFGGCPSLVRKKGLLKAQIRTFWFKTARKIKQ